ncbi:hypothetical protein PM082_003445 [Marasmius tenuissimus]|nr:hypothetical protein PM082_003445 [Marasmius tenuissimus]
MHAHGAVKVPSGPLIPLFFPTLDLHPTATPSRSSPPLPFSNTRRFLAALVRSQSPRRLRSRFRRVFVYTMAPRPSKDSKASGSGQGAKPKRPRSTGRTGKKKLTPFNKFIKEELHRLKESEPDISHQDRFKLATANWKKAPENPNREKD